MHDAAEYRGRALYLVGAARAGQASATQWVAILRALASASNSPSPVVVPIADLSRVPRLLRGLVHRRFSKNPQRAVLLDWHGDVARRLAFDPERCTIVAVDTAGRPVLRTSTLATDTATIAAFAQRADSLLYVGGPAAQ